MVLNHNMLSVNIIITTEILENALNKLRINYLDGKKI